MVLLRSYLQKCYVQSAFDFVVYSVSEVIVDESFWLDDGDGIAAGEYFSLEGCVYEVPAVLLAL